MSAKTYKTALREAVLPLLNSGISEETILNLINTVTEVCNPNDWVTLTPRQILNVFKEIEHCDTACAFGKGHQSTVICARRGPHDDYHYSRRHELEWAEKDVGAQTHTINGKTYRLAFSDVGWY